MKTIKFTPEFEDELNKFGIKDEFIDNIIDQHGYDNLDAFVDKLNLEKSFSDFIDSGFKWRETFEGYGFWENIFLEAAHDEYRINNSK